jgi:hypothetical protein
VDIPGEGMMARKPTVSAQNRPAPSEEASVRRSIFVESLLCIAIRRRVQVKCLHKDDIAERLFEPIIMYLSCEHKLCVRGVEVVDRETPSDKLPMQAFKVREINGVSLTEQAFVTNPVIDRLDPAYANGIICSVD